MYVDYSAEELEAIRDALIAVSKWGTDPPPPEEVSALQKTRGYADIANSRRPSKQIDVPQFDRPARRMTDRGLWIECRNELPPEGELVRTIDADDIEAHLMRHQGWKGSSEWMFSDGRRATRQPVRWRWMTNRNDTDEEK